jgi:hypothetical protein
MARPQVADGGDGLQIWTVAANILNKQWRTADKVWSSNWGLGVELTAHSKYKLVTRCQEGPRSRTGTGSAEGPVEGSCEHGNEPSVSTKFWEVLEWLHNWRLLTNGSVQGC